MEKIAIVGVEGSGKTVLLSVLGDKYENPDEQGVFLSPGNQRALEFTKRNVTKLRRGQWPAATTTNSVLRWDLCQSTKHGKQVISQLALLDFAGEHFRLAFGEHGEAEKAAHAEEIQALKQQIDEASIVLVLVNLGDIINGDMTSFRSIETMWLTKAILDYAAGNHRCVIVLTQTDSYRAVIEDCGGPRETVAKFLPHVDNSHSDVPVLAVAAVDNVVPSVNGLPVPAEGYSSEGIDEIIAWFIDESEKEKRGVRLLIYDVLCQLGAFLLIANPWIWRHTHKGDTICHALCSWHCSAFLLFVVFSTIAWLATGIVRCNMERNRGRDFNYCPDMPMEAFWAGLYGCLVFGLFFCGWRKADGAVFLFLPVFYHELWFGGRYLMRKHAVWLRYFERTTGEGA